MERGPCVPDGEDDMSARATLASLSPTAVVQYRHPPDHHHSLAERAKFRGQVRRQVLTCDGCLLCDQQPDVRAPVPFHSSRTPAFTVIGEAPGPDESERGQPFIGRSGKLLRALMTAADIDPDDDVLWANSVSCFPNIEGKIRMPSLAEQSACRGNMFAQIEASYSPYVLLVGAKAFSTFRSDLAVTKDHGRVFVWLDRYIVMGIIHPAAALRGQSGFKKVIAADLAEWHDVVFGGDDPLQWLGETCVKCNETMVAWDRDGVPWCGRHYERWSKMWEKERDRWSNARVEQLTF